MAQSIVDKFEASLSEQKKAHNYAMRGVSGTVESLMNAAVEGQMRRMHREKMAAKKAAAAPKKDAPDKGGNKDTGKSGPPVPPANPPKGSGKGANGKKEAPTKDAPVSGKKTVKKG